MKAFWLMVIGAVLVFSFQNCGKSSFQNTDLIEDMPLSSISSPQSVKHTKYTGGQAFSLFNKKDATPDTISLKAQKTLTNFSMQDNSSLFNCQLNKEEAFEVLIHLSDFIKVTHPSLMTSPPPVCDKNLSPHKYIKLGDQDSNLFLITINTTKNCLNANPTDLLNEGKRVFIVTESGDLDIQALVDTARAKLRGSSCVEISTTD